MTKRIHPDIPKRLAARIKAALIKVQHERYSVVTTEELIEQESARVAEFESDPEAFARKYYRGHGVDSYPVITTMARTRERLDYNSRRQPVRIERMFEAERAFEVIVEEVLREVASLRPSPGRVPWPAPLSSMTKFRADKIESDRAWHEKDQRERAAWAITEAENDAKRRAELDLENEIEIAEYHRQFALLPLEEQTRQREAGAQAIAMVESGRVTKTEFFQAALRVLSK